MRRVRGVSAPPAFGAPLSLPAFSTFSLLTLSIPLQMTPSLPHATTLRTLALSSGGYATPALNDCLYAGGAGLGWGGGAADETRPRASADGSSSSGDGHARPFSLPFLPALALYTALRALHLDRNGLAGDLTGWPTLPSLAALHLAENALTSLVGLTVASAPALTLLDVSSNRLASLDSIASISPTLTCLRAGRNPLGGEEKDGEVETRPAPVHDPLLALHAAARLATLDLADCGLCDGAALFAALRTLPSLRCLAVGGNPRADVAGSFGKPSPPRRLAVAAAAPALAYLDASPVFGGERAAADAWAAGLGAPGAEAARAAWAEAERARRGELQGSGGLLEAKLAAVRAGKACWVVEVPSEGEGE